MPMGNSGLSAGRKIFVVSLHRSATQSIRDFLRGAGFRSLHWPVQFGGVDYQAKIVGQETSAKFIADTLQPVFDMFDAVSDVPLPAIYEELDARYPTALFIATYRDPFDWVRSVRRHIGTRPFDEYERSQYWRYCSGRPDALTDISDAELLRMHLCHYAGLLSYFDSNSRFLLLDLADPNIGKQLSDFLSVPARPLPRSDYLARPDSARPPLTPSAAAPGRYAIITPYYKEPCDVLERCIASVRDQTVATDHFLVADGFPQDWVDSAGVRHIRLDSAHADFGDTPRGIGAMTAVSEGYEAIGFLDADCWLEPDHTEHCLELVQQAHSGACDYVIALRHERRPDGTIMDIGQVSPDKHVDTNCFFFLKTAFHVLPVWKSIPREISIVGDRVFYNAVRANALQPVLATRKTVNYTCMWESIYRAMGETPPEGAKPNPDHHAVKRWIADLSASDRSMINRLIQTKLEELYPLYKSGPWTYSLPSDVSETAMKICHRSNETVTKKTPIAAPVPRRQKICLSMIVKNEASVIRRCLQSVLPLIDYWIVVDTGSIDGTQDIVREFLHDMPGELHERPWIDFAHNRSDALALARHHGDYSLIIDADDVLELSPGFRLPFLKQDTVTIEIRNKERRYWRPQLVRNALPWRYVGVLHEFLSCGMDGKNHHILPESRSQRRLPGAKIVMSEEGARRRLSGSDRFRRDAAVLEDALTTETDPFLISRYTFYLAQSHLDAGDKQEALAAYQQRAKLGGWDQEVFVSVYRSANLKADLGFDDEDVIATYLQAHAICKTRAEALYGASRFCRIKERFQQGYDLAKRALQIRRPGDALFSEDWIYDYGLLDEYAVNAYWIGKYEECLKACRKILGLRSIPEDMRKRVQANAEFALRKL